MSSLENSQQSNAFIIEFQNKTKALKECQNAKQGKESCMGCAEFFECETRHAYVKSAYDKMCEGEDKGFAF